MRDTPASPFIALRKRAWYEAQGLSNALAKGELPVALQELARRLRVRRVEFVPLVSTAGIVPLDDGYAIYINEKAPGARMVARKRLDCDELGFVTLNTPLRFTIAHECAHVIFVDLLGGDSRNKLYRRHWKALEDSCNRIARLLLVPKARLLREGEPRLLDVDKIHSLTKAFGVSPEVLIYRLRLGDVKDAFEGEDGLIAYICEREGDLKVSAVYSLGPWGKVRWPAFTSKDSPEVYTAERTTTARWRSGAWDRDGITLERLLLSSNARALLERKEPIRTDATVLWHTQQVLPCKLSLRPVHRNPFGALLTVRVVGQLESSRTEGKGHIGCYDPHRPESTMSPSPPE